MTYSLFEILIMVTYAMSLALAASTFVYGIFMYRKSILAEPNWFYAKYEDPHNNQHIGVKEFIEADMKINYESRIYFRKSVIFVIASIALIYLGTVLNNFLENKYNINIDSLFLNIFR